MTETIKGSDLISLNFSVKPLVGNRSKRQVATLVTSGCAYNKDLSDRTVSTRETPIASSTLAAHCLAPGQCSVFVGKRQAVEEGGISYHSESREKVFPFSSLQLLGFGPEGNCSSYSTPACPFSPS